MDEMIEETELDEPLVDQSNDRTQLIIMDDIDILNSRPRTYAQCTMGNLCSFTMGVLKFVVPIGILMVITLTGLKSLLKA